MTEPEFQPDGFICNLVPSKDTDNDWTFEDSVAAGAAQPLGELPASVDRRAAWWTINNQEQTGSCVGWATADSVCRYQLVDAGRLTNDRLLSARYAWMASKETDVITARPETFIERAGTTLKAALDIARKYGLATEELLPFHIATNMFLGSENAFYAQCAMLRITSYFNLGKNTANWRAWLASTGPLLCGLDVDSAWDNAAATGGLIDDFHPETVRGGHAVAVVGYRADGRFIVRNSWGTNWGDSGFGYVSPAYIAAGFFSEAYGVTV